MREGEKMRRKYVSVLTAGLIICIAAAGCGKKEDAVEAGTGQMQQQEETVGIESVNPSDYVRIPDLSTLKTDTGSSAYGEVTDEDVEKELDTYRSYLSHYEEITDRDTVQEGDYVNIDFTGTCGGKEFPGGSAQGYDLLIGSGAFIEGFEDQLIGVKKGDTVEIKCSFPESYFEESLAGKEAVFVTKVNMIETKVTPELDDDAVAEMEISKADGSQIQTVEELKEYIREYLTAETEYYRLYESRENAIRQLLSATEVVKDYPEELIEKGIDHLIAVYGISDETATKEYRASLRESAKSYITETLAVKAAAQEMKIEISKEEIETRYESDYGNRVMYDEIDDAAVRELTELIRREKVADMIISG